MESLVGSYEAKTHLPSLLERVARGERFTITKHGKPVARLVPVEAEATTDVRQVVERMRAFRENGPRLGGDLSVRDLVEEGRRD
jgi:prevent-host-death family protein